MTKVINDIVTQPIATVHPPGDNTTSTGVVTLGNIIDHDNKDGTKDVVPHYVATVTVTPHRSFMVLFALSVILSIIYFFYRIRFLVAVEVRVHITREFAGMRTSVSVRRCAA